MTAKHLFFQKISLILYLTFAVSLVSYGQCPTPPPVWDVEYNVDVTAVCGNTNNITILVRVVEDTNAENVYFPGPKDASCFILPSGWSFISATRGGTEKEFNTTVRKWTVVLQPSAYSSGVAKVRSGYGCTLGNNYYSEWHNFTIRRVVPNPVITSTGSAQTFSNGVLLCSPTNFTVNSSGATSYLWQNSGGVSANGSTSSSAYITATSSGTISVTSFNSFCNVQSSGSANISVGYGVPSNVSFTADGDGGSFINMCSGNSKFLSVNANFSSSYNFQLLNGSASLLYYGGNTASFTAYNTGTYRIEASASNCFGSGSNTKYINVINCSSSAYTVGPNPASSSISVTYEKDTPTDLMPDNIKLFDSKMTEYFSEDIKSNIKSKKITGYAIEIDVSKIPRGEYYLHITNKNHPETDKRLEKLKVILQ
ncbi:T9SS type A sorting domain-containing protein [Flectobacillus roseus]|uniref:Ig-like domain-containing protein n=1 Tax=Flectobacillus roseus TaxID=502259 RepID=A0ABT6Y3Z6_9BACT|nr:hypothetical protein [Flectobacillus roseus]MDI9858292.1 hypothetical protein [Flectobacillus roseus]